ncbi:hypothetical protein [Qipengyuania sp. JC766]|uniref:hypothetical protein n=1 Tax=Qipengyuania sp. JC766 TaxID=3232139 RepID=UPI00345A2957
MRTLLIGAAVLLTIPGGPALAQTQEAQAQDVAYEELQRGQNDAAIRKIDQDEALREADAASLINLGVALAREGRAEEARRMFEAAARSEDRRPLETADGRWVDSRKLARDAIRRLASDGFRTGR